MSLTLSAGAGDRRTYPAEPIGEGQFRATVIPVPPGADRRLVLISLRFDRSSLTVEDRTVRIGDRSLPLSELAYVENTPVPRAIATDGRVFKGRAAGMESIRFPTMPDGTRVVDLSQVAAFMVRPASEVSPLAAIDAEVEVRRGHEPLTRIKRSIRLNHPSKAPWERPTIGALPQPSEGLEALLDTGGWLELKIRGAGAAASIRAPAVEIGEAPVIAATTPGDVDTSSGSPIWQALFSPDGRFLMTAGRGGAITRWNAQDGALLGTIAWHRGPFHGAASSLDGRYVLIFGPDGRNFVSGGDDGFLKIWNLEASRGVNPTPTILGRAAAVSSLAISRDGQLVLCGSVDGTARLWQFTGGRELRRLDGHEGPVHSSAFLPDGRRAVTAGQDGSVRLWDVHDGRELRRFDGRAGAVRCVAASPDGRSVLAGYDDGTARLWDIGTGQLIRTMAGHADRVASVAFSPVGDLAASGGGPKDPTVVIWDLATGRELAASRAIPELSTRSPSHPRDPGSFPPTRMAGGIRKLLDDIPGSAGGEPLVRDLGGTIRDVVSGGGGRYLVLTLDGPRRLAVFDVNTAGVVATIPLPDGDVYIAAGASSVFVIPADRGRVQEWDLATLARRKEWPLPIRGWLSAIGLGSDSDGPLLAAWEPDRSPSAMLYHLTISACISA